MDLILWRHAEAREGTPDLSRSLTRKGQQQAQAMAVFLTTQLPKNTLIWTSEASRSTETAAFLNRPYSIKSELNPDQNVADIVPLLLAQHKIPLLVIGHQPWLGQVWEQCMTGNLHSKDYWSIKKGAFVWLKLKTQTDAMDCRLIAALSPAFLGVQ